MLCGCGYWTSYGPAHCPGESKNCGAACPSSLFLTKRAAVSLEHGGLWKMAMGKGIDGVMLSEPTTWNTFETGAKRWRHL